MTDDGSIVPTTSDTALVPADLAVRRPPALVLEEARAAARAVAEVIASNPHKVILGGRQYLQFADWQVLARFYNVSARIVETHYIELGDTCGFVARAVAVRADGLEISAAEASCATDEPKWVNKPLFQLRSMAQTRAAAKCLRNVLSFVPVLAGFADTPAEEIMDDGPRAVARRPAAPRRRATPVAPVVVTPTADALADADWSRLRTIRETAAWTQPDVRGYVQETYGLEEMRLLSRPQLEEVCAYIEQHPKNMVF